MSGWRARDPRAKALFALIVSFAVAVAPGGRALILLPVAAWLVVSCGWSRGRLWGVARAVAVLWVLSFAANAFLIPGDRLGPDGLGWLRPSREGMSAGFAHGARLAVLAAVSAWVAATTGALDLASSLEWSVRGRPRLRRAAHEALLPVVLALRLIPHFIQEAGRLLEVDRLRRGPRRGLAGVRRVARLGPLWIATVIDRAEMLALGLTLRGYRPDAVRGFARTFGWGVLDWGLVGAAAGIAVFLGAG